jgi:hypothetical protein
VDLAVRPWLSLVARIAPPDRHTKGEMQKLGAAPEHCHLFDSEGNAFERKSGGGIGCLKSWSCDPYLRFGDSAIAPPAAISYSIANRHWLNEFIPQHQSLP